MEPIQQLQDYTSEIDIASRRSRDLDGGTSMLPRTSRPRRRVLVPWLMPVLALALITALGVSFLLSALNVAYRDVGYLIPFLMRLWFFSTPIVYAASEVPEAYRTLYALNPMVGVVEGFRWAALGLGDPPSAMVAVSTLAAAALLVVGALYFRRMERTFADVV